MMLREIKAIFLTLSSKRTVKVLRPAATERRTRFSSDTAKLVFQTRRISMMCRVY